MTLHRGMWVGACLLLALAGCSDDKKTINDPGVFSPIITGIASNHEPAARGAENQLTALVTNVNNVPLTYHWSVAAGMLTDSTNATATWIPPDSIGTYSVTVAVEADDGGKHFYKTMTVQMSVDNEFTRWTRSDQVQLDPAPTPSGGVLYAEFHNVSTGSSDAYRVDAPLGPPSQLTTGFFSVGSPTPRADEVDFAFTAKKLSTNAGPSIYLLPFGGGDTATARVFEARNSGQQYLATPRFAPEGTRLAYATDSIDAGTSGGYYRVHWRDASNLNLGPVPTIHLTQTSSIFSWLMHPSWGPDGNGDGNPDSIMALGAFFPGTPSEMVTEMYVIPIPADSAAVEWRTWLPGAQIQTPDWSPDGQHVVFTMKNPGTNDRDIWIINRAAADISQAVRVTSGPADDSQPKFNKDGTKIFFVSNRVDRYGVTGIYGTQRRGTNVWSVAQFDRP